MYSRLATRTASRIARTRGQEDQRTSIRVKQNYSLAPAAISKLHAHEVQAPNPGQSYAARVTVPVETDSDLEDSRPDGVADIMNWKSYKRAGDN